MRWKQARIRNNQNNVAKIERWVGTELPHGTPNYIDDAQWQIIVPDWYCELLTTRGGEVLRGRQVSEQTTHVMFGEYYSGSVATPEMRLRIADLVFSIVAAIDVDGDHHELRVEARREN